MEKDKQSRKLYYSSTVTNFSLTLWNIGEINFHNCLVTSNSVTKYCRIRYYLLPFTRFFEIIIFEEWTRVILPSSCFTFKSIQSNQVHYMYWWISVLSKDLEILIAERWIWKPHICLNFKDSLDYRSSLLFG